MNTYRTTEIAHCIGIHPNTVRLYEELGLISKPERETNGYRIFTDLHMEQFKLASLGLPINSVLLPVIEMIMLAVICVSAAIYFFRWE